MTNEQLILTAHTLSGRFTERDKTPVSDERFSQLLRSYDTEETDDWTSDEWNDYFRTSNERWLASPEYAEWKKSQDERDAKSRVHFAIPVALNEGETFTLQWSETF